MTIKIMLLITEAEQNAIVNALAFTQLMHDGDAYLDTIVSFPDLVEQALLAFKEDGAANVDRLLTKIATLK